MSGLKAAPEGQHPNPSTFATTLDDYERLLDEVWGYDPMAATNTIDVFVSNLRRKLERSAARGLEIRAVRGAGYELIDGDAPPPPMLLEELLARWTENYVMHSQRVAHALA